MSFCSNCGTSLKDTMKFCIKCGQPNEMFQPIVNTAPAAQTNVNNQPSPNGAYTQPGGNVQQNNYGAQQYGYANAQNSQQFNSSGSNPNQHQNTGAQPTVNYTPVQQMSPDTLIQTLSKKVKTEAIVWYCIAIYQIVFGFINLIFMIDTGEYANLISAISLFVVAVVNIVSAGKNLKYSKDVLANPVGIVAKFTPLGALIATLIYNLLFGGVLGVIGSVLAFITRNFVISNTQMFQQIEARFSGNTQNSAM